MTETDHLKWNMATKPKNKRCMDKFVKIKNFRPIAKTRRLTKTTQPRVFNNNGYMHFGCVYYETDPVWDKRLLN